MDNAEKLVLVIFAYIRKPLGAVIFTSIMTGAGVWVGTKFSKAQNWDNIEPTLEMINERQDAFERRPSQNEQRDSLFLSNQQIMSDKADTANFYLRDIVHSIEVITTNQAELKADTKTDLQNQTRRIDQIYNILK